MKKTTVWAIGNPLLQDDAVGLETAALLQKLSLPGLTIHSCELAPANYLGTLDRENPEMFLLLDASDMKLAPGEIRKFRLDRIVDASFTSHDLPLDQLLNKVLKAKAETWVIAVQPLTTDLGIGLSDVVRTAAGRLAQIIEQDKLDEIAELE